MGKTFYGYTEAKRMAKAEKRGMSLWEYELYLGDKQRNMRKHTRSLRLAKRGESADA